MHIFWGLFVKEDRMFLIGLGVVGVRGGRLNAARRGDEKLKKKLCFVCVSMGTALVLKSIFEEVINHPQTLCR